MGVGIQLRKGSNIQGFQICQVSPNVRATQDPEYA